LDFSLMTSGSDSEFGPALEQVKRALAAEGYPIEVTVSDRKAVASAWVRFPGLAHELGLAPRAAQTLSVKVKLDTYPPTGAGIETTVVRRHVTLHLCHYDKASLLAGKVHAILSRPWVKGRDLYDLAWYLADRNWPAPNLMFLNASLIQTGWKRLVMTAANWRLELLDRIEGLDWEKARADVRPFLERTGDLSLVTLDVLHDLLQGKKIHACQGRNDISRRERPFASREVV
jgi:hypothetical protein